MVLSRLIKSIHLCNNLAVSEILLIMLHRRSLAHTSFLKFQIKSFILSLLLLWESWCSKWQSHSYGFLDCYSPSYSRILTTVPERDKFQALQFCAILITYTCVTASGVFREILMCKLQIQYNLYWIQIFKYLCQLKAPWRQDYVCSMIYKHIVHTQYNICWVIIIPESITCFNLYVANA